MTKSANAVLPAAFLPCWPARFLKTAGRSAARLLTKLRICGILSLTTKKELPRLCGSKYVQSEIGSVFADIQRRLKQGQEILFVGTPCQAAGLRAYLRKEYDTLYIADLVCHGVPSAAVFERYLKETVENCRQVSEISFRDKSNGWKQLTLCVRTETKRF